MRRTVWTYWVLTFLYRLSMSFVMPVYVLFLLGRGLDLFQINLVNLIYYLSLFATEIPTGAYADVFGRRKSCLLSCLLFAVGLVVYINASSVWGFGLAEATIGIGSTFANGAYQAWLVDRLRHFGHEPDLRRVFARAQQSQQVGIMVGASLGGAMAQRYLMLPWMVAAGIMLVNLVLIFFLMKEEYFVPRKLSFSSGLASTKDAAMNGIRLSSQSSAIRFVLLMGLVQMFAVQAPNMEWQPFFAKFFHSKAGDGLLFSGMAFAIGIGSMLSPMFCRFVKDDRRSMLAIQAGIGLCILGAAVLGRFPLVLGVFLFHEVGRGMYVPVRDTYLNRHIQSQDRATLLSCASISNHVGGMVGLLVSGILAQQFSMEVAWFVSGAALLLAAAV